MTNQRWVSDFLMVLFLASALFFANAISAQESQTAATSTTAAPAENVGILPRPQSKAQDVQRVGDKSLENVIRTDERYGHDGLFQGPRGWDYWNYLEHPKPIQDPDLWPDMQSTYFVGRLVMPSSSTLTLHFQYPHARYFEFALYKAERNTFVALESLSGQEIKPDEGSTNPFLVGANRLAENRNFTIKVVAQDAPKDTASRAKHTVYAGSGNAEVNALIRIYLSDEGYDGAGWGPATSPSAGVFPTYELTLADGTKISAEQIARQYARPVEAKLKTPFDVQQWEGLVHAKTNDPTLNPATAPARKDPRWVKFWTLKYSVVGAFKTPQEQAQMPYQGAMEGGGDPATQYMIVYLSRKFGPIYVMRAKMPKFPNTYAGADHTGLAVMPDAQTQYFSIVSCAAPPSGQIADGLTDMQIPIDAEGYYTVVVSRPEDRPKNATVEKGIAWINWGPGESLNSPANRTDWGMLMMRIMASNPDWANGPARVTQPGTEESVMGPYYPRGYYTDKASFEKEGPRK